MIWPNLNSGCFADVCGQLWNVWPRPICQSRRCWQISSFPVQDFLIAHQLSFSLCEKCPDTYLYHYREKEMIQHWTVIYVVVFPQCTVFPVVLSWFLQCLRLCEPSPYMTISVGLVKDKNLGPNKLRSKKNFVWKILDSKRFLVQ